MQENKISQFYTAEQVNTAVQKIAEIKAQFTGLLTLLPDERTMYLRMGERTVPFVQKAIDYGVRTPAFVPSFVSMPELQKDFQSAQMLLQVSKQLQELQNLIDDTLLVAGSEAYTSALAIYKNTRQAASHGVQGASEASDDMQNRFAGQGPKKKPSDEK